VRHDVAPVEKGRYTMNLEETQLADYITKLTTEQLNIKLDEKDRLISKLIDMLGDAKSTVDTFYKTVLDAYDLKCEVFELKRKLVDVENELAESKKAQQAAEDELSVMKRMNEHKPTEWKNGIRTPLLDKDKLAEYANTQRKGEAEYKDEATEGGISKEAPDKDLIALADDKPPYFSPHFSQYKSHALTDTEASPEATAKAQGNGKKSKK